MFIFTLMYALTLYGTAFVIVSFLPTKRSSGIAATLWHIVSYYLIFTISDPATPSSIQYGLSILPNVCMGKIVNQIFFYNYQTDEGLTFSTLSVEYQNFSFRGGILMMLFDVVLWTALGLYLDQVVPSDYGVAKPWNFCCKSSKRRIEAGDDRQRLIDDEANNEDKRNFEGVADGLKK